jgi:molecular chaperone DnaK (HSP70)
VIGRSYDQIKEAGHAYDFKIAPAEDKTQGAMVLVDGKDAKGEFHFKFSAEQISTMILKDMKRTAEEYMGEKVDNAVVTCPAYFNHAQRVATLAAAEAAGFKNVSTITEPTAAAMAYGLFVAGKKTVVVFDLGEYSKALVVPFTSARDAIHSSTLIICYDRSPPLFRSVGGGTLDVSVLSIDDGVFEVLATNGDNYLGGEDFLHLLVTYVQKKCGLKHLSGAGGKRGKGKRWNALREACEAAKLGLSKEDEVTVRVELPEDDEEDEDDIEGKGGDKGGVYECVVTRKTFEGIVDGLFKRCLAVLDKVSGLLIDSIDSLGEVSGLQVQ